MQLSWDLVDSRDDEDATPDHAAEALKLVL